MGALVHTIKTKCINKFSPPEGCLLLKETVITDRRRGVGQARGRAPAFKCNKLCVSSLERTQINQGEERSCKQTWAHCPQKPFFFSSFVHILFTLLDVPSCVLDFVLCLAFLYTSTMLLLDLFNFWRPWSSLRIEHYFTSWTLKWRQDHNWFIYQHHIVIKNI